MKTTLASCWCFFAVFLFFFTNIHAENQDALVQKAKQFLSKQIPALQNISMEYDVDVPIVIPSGETIRGYRHIKLIRSFLDDKRWEESAAMDSDYKILKSLITTCWDGEKSTRWTHPVGKDGKMRDSGQATIEARMGNFELSIVDMYYEPWDRAFFDLRRVISAQKEGAFMIINTGGNILKFDEGTGLLVNVKTLTYDRESNTTRVLAEYQAEGFFEVQGYWIPGKMTRTITDPRLGTARAVFTVDKTSVIINQTLDKGVFEMIFPEGCRVSNKITGEHYTVGQKQ